MDVRTDEKWPGRRLAALMKALGIDSLTLAVKLGVSERAVLNWLADKHRMGLSYRRALTRMERLLQARPEGHDKISGGTKAR